MKNFNKGFRQLSFKKKDKYHLKVPLKSGQMSDGIRVISVRENSPYRMGVISINLNQKVNCIKKGRDNSNEY